MRCEMWDVRKIELDLISEINAIKIISGLTRQKSS